MLDHFERSFGGKKARSKDCCEIVKHVQTRLKLFKKISSHLRKPGSQVIRHMYMGRIIVWVSLQRTVQAVENCKVQVRNWIFSLFRLSGSIMEHYVMLSAKIGLNSGWKMNSVNEWILWVFHYGNMPPLTSQLLSHFFVEELGAAVASIFVFISSTIPAVTFLFPKVQKTLETSESWTTEKRAVSPLPSSWCFFDDTLLQTQSHPFV